MTERGKSELINFRRSQLTQAAYKVVGEKGYNDFTIRDIAREAGLSTGLIHYYFKNKEDLLFKLLKEMNANLGQDDGEHILKHQDEIPVALRGKVAFVFTDWRHPDNPGLVYSVCWNGGQWVRYWNWLDDDYWGGNSRLLRRK